MATPFTPDGKLDIKVSDIIMAMLEQDGGFREFIRSVKPDTEWQVNVTLNLTMANNILALELLDKLEEAEFKGKKP